MSDELMELPEGWLWVKTGEICEGIVPGRTKPRDFSGTIPWITLPDVIDLHISRSQSNLTVTREGAEEVGMKVMPKGTVLMSCVGQFGIICIAEDEVVPNQQFHGFICPANVLPEYVAYALMTEIDQITQMASATTIAYINKTKCNSIQIPLAPSNEQKRIVAQIEALRERSQKAKAALEAIPELCDRFRQSVLAAAFRGDLTADWREENPDVEPASVLLERTAKELKQDLDEVTKEIDLDQFFLPNSWTWAKLKLFTKEIKAGKNFSCPEVPVTESTVGLVKISAVTWGEFDPKETKTVDDASKVDPSLFICAGDFLISRANTIELVGASVVVNEIAYRIMLSDKVWRVTFLEVDKKFINLYLKSHYGRKEIESRATGNQLSMRNISQNAFKDVPVALPPLSEQQEIVKQIETLFKTIEQIEQQYKTLQTRLDRLNQFTSPKPSEVNWSSKTPTMNLPPCCSNEFGQSGKRHREIKRVDH